MSLQRDAYRLLSDKALLNCVKLVKHKLQQSLVLEQDRVERTNQELRVCDLARVILIELLVDIMDIFSCELYIRDNHAQVLDSESHLINV